jgi:hypothetical protein
MIFNHIISLISATILSVRYGFSLRLTSAEWVRYLKKSANLGLCYAGFATSTSLRQAWMVGKAGFLCCAYDVVTDWRSFDQDARKVFEKILRKSTSQVEVQKLAIDLYEKELSNTLRDDGLERGEIALRFIIKMMGCEKAMEIKWNNIEEIGRLLQIVDDVLDYEDDLINEDMNCLKSIKRDIYLEELFQKFGDQNLYKLFGNQNSILVTVIKKAGKKAKLLSKDNLELL